MNPRHGLRCADPALDAPRHDEAIDDHGHLVQFYESDDFLAESVRDFVLAGLEAGEAAVIVATKPHRMAIDELLQASDLDVQTLRNEGRYVLMDAAETLSRFMVDGEPEPAFFSAAVGSVVARAAEAGNGIRIFGEMVAVLWAEGNVPAALKLEGLWNELVVTHPFSLLCAYPLAGFGDSTSFKEVCRLHERVIPAESYTALKTADDRLRAITDLQQKASAGEQERQVRALELNDAIVQGLAAAKMALELEEYKVLEEAVAATLGKAVDMVSRLLEESSLERSIAPGDLRGTSRSA
ncbi:MAG: hypothetical protein QOG04_1355 [Actinomycetota bacterium]|nr:hypothetical protein [Actinomycetota bacterium]